LTRAGNLKVWVALLAAAAVAAGTLNSTVKPARAAFPGIPNAIPFTFLRLLRRLHGPTNRGASGVVSRRLPPMNPGYLLGPDVATLEKRTLCRVAL